MLSALKLNRKKTTPLFMAFLFLGTQVIFPFALSRTASAASTVFLSPTSTGGSQNGWTNPTNAFSSNNVYATETTEDDDQSYENFGFSIPAGSTINGIELSFEGYASDSSGCSLETNIFSDSDNNLSNIRTQAVTGTDTVYTVGGAADLWGNTWVADDFSNANFRAEVQFDDSSGSGCSDGTTFSLDHLQVKVHYTEPVPQPDLVAVKTNDTGGQATDGVAFNWNIRVQNDGVGNAVFTNNQELLRDERSTNDVTNGTPSVTNGPGVTGTIVCGTGNSFDCDASGTVTIVPGGYFDVTFSATPTDTGALSNPQSNGTCKVDRNNSETESNENNNNCSNSVTVNVNTGTPNPALGESCGLDIALVIDSSGSISDSELAQMKTAYNSFVSAFLPETPTQFSVTDFDSTASVVQAFTNNETDLTNSINGTSSGGFTNWEDGLLKAQSTFDPRPSKQNLVLFASDGNPNTVFGSTPGGTSESQSVSEAAGVANALKANGTRVVALGIGNDLDVDNLKAISGPNVGTTVASDVITSDFATLAQDLAELADELCGGTITAKKLIDQDGSLNTTNDQTVASGWTFDVNGSPTDPSANQTDAQGFTPSVEVEPGTYSVNETQQNGYTLLSASCMGASNNGVRQGDAVTGISVAADDIVSCTFINTPVRGTITVNKVTDPANDPTTFSITASGTGTITGQATRDISTTQSVVYEVGAGTYNVSEANESGWSKTGNSCTNLVISSPNQNLECTITNTKLATLTILKDALPNDGQDFEFSTGFGEQNFFLDDDDDNTLSNQKVFSDLAPGQTYSVTELSTPGWSLTDLECDNVDQQGTTASVTPTAGQNITCEFTNTKLGSISGFKYEVNADGTVVGSLADWTINLLLDGNAYGSTSSLADGSYSFGDLLPGNYTISELLDAGYTQIIPSSPGTISETLGAGEVSTENNFGNFENGSISGYKFNDHNGNAVENDGDEKLSGWEIKLFLDPDLSNEIATDTTDENGYNFTNLAPGTYWVCETGQTGWTQTYPENNACHQVVIDESAESNSNTNFGNQGRGSIQVIKDVDTDGDGQVDVSGATDWVWDIDGSGDYATGLTQNVPAESYQVSEEQQTDYHFVSVECSGERQTTQAETTSVTVSPGEDVVCTFTNARDTGTLKVTKVLIPSNDSGSFNLLIDGNVEASEIDNGGTTGAVTVATGLHNVSETAGTGSDLDDYITEITGDCAADGSVTVSKEESAECTITNTRKASITVIKDAVPDHEQDFDFTLSKYVPILIDLENDFLNSLFETSEVLPESNNLVSEFTLDDDGDNNNEKSNSEETTGLVPGWYEIEETQVEGWDLVDIDCDDLPVLYLDSFTSETVDAKRLVYVGPGDEVTCTFINEKRGTVTIIKDAKPNSNQEFTFEHNFDGEESEDFVLVDDGENPELSEKEFENVKPGQYWIEEGYVYGWKQKYITCDNEYEDKISRIQTEVYEDDDRYYITVRPGEDVTCTVKNKAIKPELTVIKEVINDNGNDKEASDFKYTLYDVDGLNLSYPASSQGTTFKMTPGEYYVEEDPAVGYTVSYSEGCSGELDWGDEQVCYITNDDNPPVINITKSNNKPAPTVVGDTVTYTLEVTVPDNSGIVYNAVVTDLPPENFEYIPGSFTAFSTNNDKGDLVAGGITTEPAYASPGDWEIGDMMPGEKVTLTYQARINGNVTPGIYPDLAFVKGMAAENVESPEVLGNITIADNPFVGSDVEVTSPASTVFTPPEVLVNTGQYLPALIAVIPAFLLGLTLLAYRRSRRLSQEGGQR